MCSVIYKYDIRLCIPNSCSIPSDAMHSLEHILAIEVSSIIGAMKPMVMGIEYIDISPMGCGTGFILS